MPVTVLGGRPAPPPVPPRPAWPWVLLLVTVVSVPVGYDAVRSARAASVRRTAALSVAELAALRLVVTDTRAGPFVPGVPGAAVQEAPVQVVLRNDSGFPVQVLAAQLDGGQRTQLTAGVRPGGEAPVAAGWRVRCAEVGALPGPSILLLRVGARRGVYDVPVRLPPYQPALHLAAARACDVLVPGASS